MNCPKCYDQLVDTVHEPGTKEKQVIGVECIDCGFIGVCPRCGAWSFEPCRPWCPEGEPK